VRKGKAADRDSEVSTSICQIQQSEPTAAVVQPTSVQAQRHAALTLVPLESPTAATLVKLAAPISSAGARALGGRRRRDADDLAHQLADHTHAGQIHDGMRYDGSLSLLKMLAAIRELHQGIRVAEAPAQSPRIPRIRWAREEQF
jgi:hypothetical protein